MSRRLSPLAVALAVPPLVAGTIWLSALADPWTRALLGRALGPTIEALDAAVVLNLYAMMVLYVPALVEGLRERSRTFAWRLVAGICVGWWGTLHVFANLTWVYLTQERDVLRDSVAPPTLRLAYLALLLTGTTFHISTALHHKWGWWRCIFVWSACVAVGVLALATAETAGWMP